MPAVSSGDPAGWCPDPGRPAHYAIFEQWAEQLVGNALDPDLQEQTDDFTGFFALLTF